MKITDDIFKSICNESVWISITISLKFVPKGPIDYKSALVQVMAWHRTGEKPLPESMLTQFTDAYIPILTPDYWHPPQSNFTEYKQDVVAVFYAPVNGQWVN